MRTKTEKLGEGHKSSTFPANQGARVSAAKPLDILTLVGHTMRKVQRLNVCGAGEIGSDREALWQGGGSE